MLQMNESKANIIKTLIDVLGYISVFISIVLGFLIVYSNNFLVKRRKKEFGLYLTLGMSKRKVSTILVIETLLVGLISLLAGLVIGVTLSQFLSILTAKLFEVDMTNFEFVFSNAALIKTIIYFGIIFLLVMIFNIISISRYKLIDLLNAGKKNEKIKFRNRFVLFAAFILSIASLSYAYKILFDGALLNFNNSNFIYMIIAGTIGTFLLFFSAAGFFLKISQWNKKFYYKNLNMFVLKQVNNKVNTTVFSTTIISLMLLLTIGILSTSISLVSVFNDGISTNNRTDFSITESITTCYDSDGMTYCYSKTGDNDIKNLSDNDYFKDYVNNYVYYKTYNDESLTYESIMSKSSKEELLKKYDGMTINGVLDVISESDYNKILELYNENEKIDLSKNEYLLTSNFKELSDYYEDYYKNDGEIKFNDINLRPATNKIKNISFINSSGGSNMGTIVVDDSLLVDIDSDHGTIIGNYVSTKDIEQLENSFKNEIGIENTDNIHYVVTTKIDMSNANINVKAIFTFIGLYLGIVFAISSATVLAIGQLSEASDNKERYKVLRELGADNKTIKKALFSQIAIAFGFPLIVAIIHSIFGLKEINNVIKILGNINLTKNIILTTLFILVLFGGYFISTYLFSKSIIEKD